MGCRGAPYVCAVSHDLPPATIRECTLQSMFALQTTAAMLRFARGDAKLRAGSQFLCLCEIALAERFR
jgi:hypothetical protein